MYEDVYRNKERYTCAVLFQISFSNKTPKLKVYNTVNFTVAIYKWDMGLLPQFMYKLKVFCSS